MSPTKFLQPFGTNGPCIALFGRKTGDWNISCFQKEGDHLNCNGLYSRFNDLAERYSFSEIFLPIPTDCNRRICYPKDFNVSIHQGPCGVALKRGVKADGVVLSHHSVGAIASADCPTIVAYCPAMKTTIMAHAGSKSLLDFDAIGRGKNVKECRSVVREVLKIATEQRFTTVKVFITCGIAGQNYSCPDLIPWVINNLGSDCVVRPTGLDLKKIIARMFEFDGVKDVMTDVLDTYGDLDPRNRIVPLWHSYRRASVKKLTIEKSMRNLVMVMNR